MEFAERLVGKAKEIGKIPIVFFGLGIYRAWISTVHTYTAAADPFSSFFGLTSLYDLSLALTALVCAVFARRIGPLVLRKRVGWATAGLMTIGSLFSIIGYSASTSMVAFSYVGIVLSGMGTALIILQWAEFFGSLNPLRVALYYSGAILLGALVTFLLSGYRMPFLMGFSLVLPFISIIWLKKSMERIPDEDKPKKTWGRYSFPWKPVALMAVCAFAYGYGNLFIEDKGTGNYLSVAVPAAVVFIGSLSTRKRFDFSFVYRFALPIMIVGFLLVTPSLGFSSEIKMFCVSVGYISFSMLIMLILCNISYRYGIGIIWLCGIERAVRYLFIVLGRSLKAIVGQSPDFASIEPTVNTVIAIALVAAFSILFFSERELSSKWGIVLRKPMPDEPLSADRLSERLFDIAKEYGLSSREEEVLQLLAQKKTVSKIERELYIANGTVKAHVRHIYVKLGINSREELYEMLGIAEEGRVDGDAVMK